METTERQLERQRFEPNQLLLDYAIVRPINLPKERPNLTSLKTSLVSLSGTLDLISKHVLSRVIINESVRVNYLLRMEGLDF